MLIPLSFFDATRKTSQNCDKVERKKTKKKPKNNASSPRHRRSSSTPRRNMQGAQMNSQPPIGSQACPRDPTTQIRKARHVSPDIAPPFQLVERCGVKEAKEPKNWGKGAWGSSSESEERSVSSEAITITELSEAPVNQPQHPMRIVALLRTASTGDPRIER